MSDTDHHCANILDELNHIHQEHVKSGTNEIALVNKVELAVHEMRQAFEYQKVFEKRDD